MKFKWTALVAIALLTACASAPDKPADTAAAAPLAGGTRYMPREAVYAVGAIPGATIRDEQRNRDVVMNIEYPTRGGPYPVIIFSHGFGATKDSYTALSAYWAGRGFIVIRPSHADAGALRSIIAERRARAREEREKEQAQQPPREEARPPRDRGRGDQRATPAMVPQEPPNETLWQAQTPADWQARARDISAIIDAFPALQEKYPELAGKIDTAHIGVGGHSYGAFTAMLVGGATNRRATGVMADPRVKAVILMSPQGTGAPFGFTEESFRTLKIPALFLTGSMDRGLGADGDPKWRHEPFEFSPAGDKYFVSFEGARHSTFAGNTGELTDAEIGPAQQTVQPMTDRYGNPIMAAPAQQGGRVNNAMLNDRRIFGAVKLTTSAFWDAYLKDDADAKEYLSSEAGGLKSLSSTQATVEKK